MKFVGGGSSTSISEQSQEPNTPAIEHRTQVSFKEIGEGTLFSGTVNLNSAGATGNCGTEFRARFEVVIP